MLREVTLSLELSMDAHGAIDLEIVGWPAKCAEMAVAFRLKPGDVEKLKAQVSREIKILKTHPQLGYLFGHLGPAALDYLQSCGWSSIRTKEQAIDFYKAHLGFVETHINEITGKTISEPKSLAGADKEDVAQFIQDLYLELITEGLHVWSPDEYKKKRRYEKDNSNRANN